MITLVWRTDVHLADKAPQSRTDDWASTVLGKLRQVGEIAREVKAQAVLDGGDFFHIKTPSRTTHELIQRVAAVHAEYPCPVYALRNGNHDVKFGDGSYLAEAPLGVLFQTGVFRMLDDHVFTQGDYQVRVVGVPYHGTTYDMNRLTTITKGDEDCLVVAAHLLASQAGGEMFGGEDIVRYADLLGLDPDVWCFLPGTKIIDWNGRAFPIEEVRDSMALSGREGTVSVEETHPVRLVDEDVVVLDVEGVPGDLIPGVTQEHPFWVAKGLQCRLASRASRRCHPDKPATSYPCSSCHAPPKVASEWCPAGAIEPGDYMAVPVPRCGGGVAEPGLARLLGLYLAEGHIILNRDRKPVAGVGWSFHEDETALHGDVDVLVQTHFGLQTHKHQGGTGRCTQVCAYGSEVSEFFLTHGGRGSATKRFSSWVWGLSAASRLELLVGWLDGDGHARNLGRYDRTKAEVMGATVSPQLATQMFLLALSIGLRPYYTIRPEREVTFPNGRTSEALPCHIISFYGEDAVVLAGRLGVEIPPPSKTKVAGFFADGLYWIRVRGVSRKPYKGPVYNMRTSTEEYVAGLLLTHNCFGHWHKNQGVFQQGKKHIVNIGSLTRGALNEDDVKRIPEVAILRFDPKMGISVERRPLKVQPAAEVFDLEGRTRQEARTMTVDAFVDSVKETLTKQDRPPLLDEIRSMSVPEEVKERLVLYLEAEGSS